MNVSGNLNLRGISQFATTLGGLFSQASSFLAPTKIPFEYPTLGCAFGYQVIEIAMRSYSLKLLAIANCQSSSAHHCSSPLFTKAKNSHLTSVRC
jgi:hypothetical protein